MGLGKIRVPHHLFLKKIQSWWDSQLLSSSGRMSTVFSEGLDRISTCDSPKVTFHPVSMGTSDPDIHQMQVDQLWVVFITSWDTRLFCAASHPGCTVPGNRGVVKSIGDLYIIIYSEKNCPSLFFYFSWDKLITVHKIQSVLRVTMKELLL